MGNLKNRVAAERRGKMVRISRSQDGSTSLFLNKRVVLINMIAAILISGISFHIGTIMSLNKYLNSNNGKDQNKIIPSTESKEKMLEIVKNKFSAGENLICHYIALR